MADKDAKGDKPEEPQPAPPPRRNIAATIAALLLVTLIAGGAGGGLGLYIASAVEEIVAARANAAPAKEAPAIEYSGDLVLQPIDAVVTNLAEPSDTWIRLETSIVFANGALPDPHVTAAEIRQDIVAYARTMPLRRLEGPSALLHLREDLNERVAVRTGGQVRELIIESMVVQ